VSVISKITTFPDRNFLYSLEQQACSKIRLVLPHRLLWHHQRSLGVATNRTVCVGTYRKALSKATFNGAAETVKTPVDYPDAIFRLYLDQIGLKIKCISLSS